MTVSRSRRWSSYDRWACFNCPNRSCKASFSCRHTEMALRQVSISWSSVSRSDIHRETSSCAGRGREGTRKDQEKEEEKEDEEEEVVVVVVVVVERR